MFCQAFLGDLILKGKKFGSKQGKNEYHPKGEQFWFQKGRKRRRSSKHGEKQKGNDRFRGMPSQHWMMVSIQASVSGSICQFLQNLYLLWLCQKGGDCKENGTFKPLFYDFGDRMTTQSMGLMVLLSEHF